MTIVVREANSTDATMIVSLVRELAESMDESTSITEDYVCQYVNNPGAGILLAEESGKVIGLLSFSLRPNLFHAADGGLIEDLIVCASARGKGVGKALMVDLMARLAAKGCAEVSVSTMADNAEAIKFYRSHGLVDEALFLEKHF